jgi:signal transduction histidine kinase
VNLPAESHPEDPGRALRRSVAASQHALLSLVDLTRQFSREHDVYGVVDALLLNLMGQLGSAHAVVGLRPEGETGAPAVVRAHGLEGEIAGALLAASWIEMERRFRDDPTPISAEDCAAWTGLPIAPLARKAGIALFAPLRTDQDVFGVIMLGPPVGNRAYEGVDLEVLEASLSIASAALASAQMQARVLEANRRLRIANDELRGLDRLKSEFISNVSHELRTPLAVFVGCISYLSDYDAQTEQARKLLQEATQGAQALQSVIERLLTLSQARQGDLEPSFVVADAAKLVQEWYEERRPGASLGLHEMRFVNLTSGSRVRCDESWLRMIVDELVDNAIKFTPKGCHVWVTLSDHVEAGRRWVRLDLEDDGPGIGPQSLPHVFEEFRQLDGSSTRRVGGMGIGLPMAQRLADAMGGQLSASSEVDVGARFTLQLPAIEEAGAEARESP